MENIAKKQLLENIRKALKGWRYWHLLNKKVKLDNDVVVLLPENEEELHYCAAFFLNDLLIQQQKNKAVFLTCNEEMTQKYLKKYTQNVKKVVYINSEEAENLISYYRLYCFDLRLWIASFSLPFGREGDLLLKRYPDDMHELFAMCVYRLKPYNQKSEKQLKGKM